MLKRNVWVVLVAGCALAGGAAFAQPAGRRGGEDAATAGERMLAEDLSVMAQNLLRNAAVTPSRLRQTGALLEGAARLNPAEARYPRLLVEAMLQVGDTAAAADALRMVLKVEPTNRTAQIQFIDVIASRRETVESRLAYLNDLLAREGIAPEVRSHVAVLVARQLIERSLRDEAETMLVEALKQNPLNPEALRLHYDLFGQRGSPPDRVRDLLAMLRANPAQPPALASVAREVAEAGLVNDSTSWYAQAVNVTGLSGQPADWGVLVDYASNLIVADQAQFAADMLQRMLKADTSNVDAWLLTLAILKDSNNKDAYDNVRKQALVVLTNRLAEARQAIGVAGATTRPVAAADVPVPDVSGDVKLLTGDAGARVDERARAAYVSAASDLAWFELYFNNQLEEGKKLTDVLRQITPEGNVTVARLDGWAYVLAGRQEEARVKLSAVADRDPLSALGLVKLGGPDAQDRANKLVSRYPSGLLGAILWAGTRDVQAKILPSADAAEIRKELDAFPKEWLDVVDHPQKFYTLGAQPLDGKLWYTYAEPILTRITIRNEGIFDLTMGADGVLKPDVWIDAQLKGLYQQALPGVAFDRIGGEVVLKRGATVSQVVRLDQGALAQIFSSRPDLSIPVAAQAVTNPVFTQQAVQPGPGGFRASFDKMYQRDSFRLNDQSRKDLLDTMAGTDDAKKIRYLEMAHVYIQVIQAQNDPQTRQWVPELGDLINRARGDRSPAVSAWATFLTGTLLVEQDRPVLVKQMTQDKDWTKRLLGLVLAQMLTPGQQKELAAPLAEKDEEPAVKKYAAAVVAAVNAGEGAAPSAIQAGTRPASMPTTVPVAPAATMPAVPAAPVGK